MKGKWTKTVLTVVGLALVAIPLAAQNPTGTLVGRVTDDAGAGLPGVVVSAEAVTLQGVRAATTSASGDYKLAFLPPGSYTVTYVLAGFAPTTLNDVKISAAQTVAENVQMQLETVSEEIVVTSEAATISETGTAATTITKQTLEELPLQRDVETAALLTPGVAATGPNNNVSISGAMSFENLWLVNGVVINENIRGQSLPLFIEDAIQETTTAVSGISAEYGRFTGGVVNAITKSGGNQIDGSFRTSFTNDDWTEKTELSGDRIDQTNEIYEATLGGPFWRDHLWFFGAGRDREESSSDQTAITLITYPRGVEEQRLEGKLTATPVEGHTLTGSYIEIDQLSANSGFGTMLDLRSLNPQREDPQEIKSANYTGILTPNFFVEAQYSERDFTIGIGSGGPPDLIEGTLMRSRLSGVRFWAPTFCGSCEDEIRNNDNLLLKGNYFLSTDTLGSHDLVFGYDTFDDIRFAINHQTGSDFTVYASDVLIDAEKNVFPVITAGRSWIRWFAVFNLDVAQPTSFKTNSYYLNDSWQLNDRWSFNLGVRYDENDGTNSQGAQVADDAKWSPRLGANYDWGGDGDLILHASYGSYVAAIANSRADATSGGGAIGSLVSVYGGPNFNTDPNCTSAGTCVTTDIILQEMFNWYFANGGITDVNGNLAGLPNLIGVSIPGATATIPDTIKSPAVDELVLGASKRLGNRGLLRGDLVYREWSDFYSDKTTLETGKVDTPAGLQDLTLVGNFGDSVLKREYMGLHLQGQYRFTDRVSLAGNYTLSQLEGNIDGETGPSGPVPDSPFNYPEYSEPRWNDPIGDLSADQRHRLRLWGIYQVLDTDHHNLSVSLLQNFFSGQPYGATIGVDTSDIVGDLGYETPPTEVTYWVTDRDAFHTDDVTRTDLSLNYSFLWEGWGRRFEVFLQPEVINVFDEQAVVAVNTTALGPEDSSTLAPFNPFTETPVEGVNWRKGSSFGEPESEDDFQQPRTYRFSVGFRF